MVEFEYVAAATVEEAVGLLREHRGEARVLAGGQSLVPLLNYRLARPRTVVDINDLPLADIRGEGGGLRLGALVRHADLEDWPEIARRCPVLGEAAGLIGNARVRALGTLGGSLAHGDPAAEWPMVMAALGARFTVRSASAARTIEAADFFTGYLSTALEPDELLTEIEVPDAAGMGHAVEEMARRAGDFAIVAVTALVRLDARGRVHDARLAFGGVGGGPVRVAAAEDALRGHEPTADRVARAADLAREALQPGSDAFASGAYRRLLAGVLARRALGRAVARALDGGPRPAPPVAPARPSPTAGPGRDRGPRGARGQLVVNGRAREVALRPHQTLLEVLRDTLGIFDAKEGCGEGVCGACTVLLDGRPVSSCLLLAASVRGRAITTVRGLERGGDLHPLQEAFVRHGAVQCGFCTPGMLLAALAFLERCPRPGREDIRHALAGNLCRCTGYAKILDAVEAYVREREPGRG